MIPAKWWFFILYISNTNIMWMLAYWRLGLSGLRVLCFPTSLSWSPTGSSNFCRHTISPTLAYRQRPLVPIREVNHGLELKVYRVPKALALKRKLHASLSHSMEWDPYPASYRLLQIRKHSAHANQHRSAHYREINTLRTKATSMTNGCTLGCKTCTSRQCWSIRTHYQSAW